MNTYEITFTRENGSTGKDRITAANEKQARKDFREIYRHSSATITDVIVAAEAEQSGATPTRTSRRSSPL